MAASCSSANASSNDKTECTSPSPTETVCLELLDTLTDGKEGAGPSGVVCGDSEGSVVGDKCLLDTEEGDDGSCHAEECDEEGWVEVDDGAEGSAGEEEEEEDKLLDKLQSSEGTAVLPSAADSASAIIPRPWVSNCLFCYF